MRKAPEDLRFPGQWFQLETGLHYNWHRHYDPKIGGIGSRTRWDLSMGRAFTHVRAVIRFRASTMGLTWDDDWSMFWSWVFGIAPSNTVYGPVPINLMT